MFSSISKSTPLTQQTTSFIANRTMTIVPVTPFDIRINGNAPPNPNSVVANAGDTITAVITTPQDILWHQFYYYTIDGVPSSFAVVNKSNYIIRVKEPDRILRWYLYFPTSLTASFKSFSGTIYNVSLGATYDIIPTNVHVLLNPLESAVYFYNTFGVQVSKVVLPAEPIDYVKIPDKQTIVVLVRGGQAFEIFLNNNTTGLTPFYARRDYSEFTDLTYITQLPGEDLITYLRRARRRKAIPPASCITFNGTYVLAAGNGSVWVVDPFDNFRLIYDFIIDEYVMNIVSLPNNNGMILVTQNQKIIRMDMTGAYTELYTGIALCQPALFNGKIYIPEGDVGLLKVYNPITNLFEADINLNDFSPSYITVVDNKMYVCGHDSERVLIFDSNLNIIESYFNDKVTTVSVVSNTILASHWLKTFKILDLEDLQRIIRVEFLSRKGPVSHIGTNPVTIKTLGNDEVYAKTPEGTWLWANGKRTYSDNPRGTLLLDNDIISINRAAKVPGIQRSNVVIGDVAYDYDVEAVAQTYYPRNIEMNIERAGDFGVYVKTITLPRAFRPCLLSIEYGLIKVNQAYYYGDFLVTAGDQVEITIETKGVSALPVLTIGQRQFVLPITSNFGNIQQPVQFEDIELEVSTPLVKQIVFTQFASLFDYIVPGYYDIVVKKNNTVITGNYYQQFGAGDKLIIEYSSSRKLYDSLDIFILGATNYRFVAKNKIGNPIDFLNYGNLINPYTRVFDPYQISTSSSNIGAPYNQTNLFGIPEIQITSANIMISNIAANSNANISIIGTDAYFVVDGNLVYDVNIIISANANLALARNVLSYYDSNITVVQHFPTGDDDGFSDLTVGFWGIINTPIKEIETPSQPTITLNNNIKGIVEFDKVTDLIDLVIEINKINQRNLNVYDLVLDSLDIKQSEARQVEIDTVRLTVDTVTIPTTEIQHIIYKKLTNDKIDRTVQRNLNFSKLYFDRSSTFSGATNYWFDKDNIINIDSLIVQKEKNLIKELPKYPNIRDITLQRNLNSNKIVIEKMRLSLPYNLKMYYDAHKLFKISASKLRHDPLKYFLSETKFKFEEQKYLKLTFSKNVKLLNNVRLAISYKNQLDLLEYLILTGNKMYHNRPDDAKKQLSSTPTIYKSKEFIPEFPYKGINYQLTIISNRENPVTSVKNNVNTFTEKIFNFNHLKIKFLFDREIDWQGFFPNNQIGDKTDFLMNKINYPMDKTIDPTKLMFNYSNSDYFPIERLEIGRTQWEEFYSTRLTFNYNDSNKFDFINKKIDYPQTRPFETKPNNDFNFSFYNTIPIGTHQSSTKTDTIPILSHIEYSSYNTQVGVYQGNLVLYNTIPEITHSELTLTDTEPEYLNINYSKNITKEDITHIESVKIDMEPRYTSGEFDKILMVPRLNDDFNINLIQTKSEKLVFADPELIEEQPALYIADLRIQDPLPFGNIKTNYSLDEVTSVKGESPKTLTGYLTYTTDEDIHYMVGQMDYDREGIDKEYYVNLKFRDEEKTNEWFVPPYRTIHDNLFNENYHEMYIKPGWQVQEYGLEPFVVYRLDIQTPNTIADYKMTLMEHVPATYFVAAPNVRFEEHLLWDHDISTVYGAFATEADAILAAQKYTEFRPFLILDTNLWSYRVLLETGLVCPLPAGRYPVAWLIRGG